MAVVKADAYGHGMLPVAGAARAGRRRLARGGAAQRGGGPARCRRHRSGPGAGCSPPATPTSRPALAGGRRPVGRRSRWALDEVAAAAPRDRPAGAGAPEGRHRAGPRRHGAARTGRTWSSRPPLRRSTGWSSRGPVVPPGLRRPARAPGHAGAAGAAFEQALDRAAALGARPRGAAPGQLRRPCWVSRTPHFDLVRPRHRGLRPDPRPGPGDRRASWACARR